jgi:hypothetical protein
MTRYNCCIFFSLLISFFIEGRELKKTVFPFNIITLFYIKSTHLVLFPYFENEEESIGSYCSSFLFDTF